MKAEKTRNFINSKAISAFSDDAPIKIWANTCIEELTRLEEIATRSEQAIREIEEKLQTYEARGTKVDVYGCGKADGLRYALDRLKEAPDGREKTD